MLSAISYLFLVNSAPINKLMIFNDNQLFNGTYLFRVTLKHILKLV